MPAKKKPGFSEVQYAKWFKALTDMQAALVELQGDRQRAWPKQPAVKVTPKAEDVGEWAFRLSGEMIDLRWELESLACRALGRPYVMARQHDWCRTGSPGASGEGPDS